MSLERDLMSSQTLRVRQRRELLEFLEFETRNKYEVTDEHGRQIAFCAEQGKGVLGFLFRQWLGHWRRFDLHFFTPNRHPAMIARHPFRFFFQRLEVSLPDGRPVGAIQQRFSFISRRFDLVDSQDNVVLSVKSPFWKPWTFPFSMNGREVGFVRKKWSGLLKEALTDADNFQVEYAPQLPAPHRLMMLAAAVFIDLQYFEKKAGQ